MNGPGYTDAKYKVIRAPRQGWRIRFDWRNFAVLALVISGSAVRALLLGH